ncbi:MAG: tRNA threonylcarbamoyladenosine biosynthesis protein TsaE [Patescibacteria group bacterium]|nr:tRNA threonylcarbamoyladenosine biosynthesis protein TsaE [Patescibacteria group bacterium]
MQKDFITNSSKQTQQLGELLAGELRGGEVICLAGDLGAGKTTFTQGLLKGLGVKGPYTSPTFVIMKQYHATRNMKHETENKKLLRASCCIIHDIYHIDAYRVGAEDVLNLGWEEIVADKNNVIIVEWAERISGVIPEGSLWVRFEWVGEKERKITFKNSPNF